MPGTILVVEDQADVRSLLRTLLNRAGFRIVEAVDGHQAMQLFFEICPDLVLLDIGLPGMDGWQVLSRIRDASQVPVCVLTAHGAETEKVRGLRAGADDYLTKPFGRQELTARVEALLRRARTSDVQSVYDDGRLTVDFARYAVQVHGEPLHLTPLEFRLLACLVRSPGEVLGRERLLEAVWNDPTGTSAGQVKLYVAYLRRKLDEAGGDGQAWIENVRGFGYRYLPPT